MGLGKSLAAACSRQGVLALLASAALVTPTVGRAGIFLSNFQNDGAVDDVYSGSPANGSAAIYDASLPGEYGYAAADLSKGALHAYSASYAYFGFDGSTARLDEALTFNAPASLSSYSVGFTFTYHGVLTPGAGYASLVADGKVYMAGRDDASFQAVIDNNPLVGPGINISAKDQNGNPIPNGLTTDGFSDVSYSLTPTGDVTFTGRYDGLAGGSPQTLSLYESIGLLTARGGVADYAHTATIALSLPAGVTVSPADPIFLSAVPEPSTWAMMLFGLLGLGAVLRARRPDHSLAALRA